jgi:hypothetical protein
MLASRGVQTTWSHDQPSECQADGFGAAQASFELHRLRRLTSARPIHYRTRDAEKITGPGPARYSRRSPTATSLGHERSRRMKSQKPDHEAVVAHGSRDDPLRNGVSSTAESFSLSSGGAQYASSRVALRSTNQTGSQWSQGRPLRAISGCEEMSSDGRDILIKPTRGQMDQVVLVAPAVAQRPPPATFSDSSRGHTHNMPRSTGVR